MLCSGTPLRIPFRFASVALLCAAVLAVLPRVAQAQSLSSHHERIAFTSGLPEDTGSIWTRIGTGPVLLVDGQDLLVNDNSGAELVAYQGLLGLLDARHDVVFRGEVLVLSNIGGDGALIEISHPGLEIIVQLYRDHLSVLERVGADETHWLGSADVDLERFREIAIHKTSSVADGGELVSVAIDGATLLTVQPRAAGELSVGRVLFGSMGYADMGATLWRWVEVDAELKDPLTPVSSASVGELKARFGG